MLFALADDRDVWHGRVREWFLTARDLPTVPMTVLQECAYLIGARLGAQAEAAFLGRMAAGEFPLEPVSAGDLPRIVDLVDAYLDLPLGWVDASIIAIAERLDCLTILTTDRRHFGVVRPAHCPRFVLAP